VDGLFGDELQKIPQAGSLLEGWAGDDPLYELPTLIIQEIISGFWRWNRLQRRGHASIGSGMRSHEANEFYHRRFLCDQVLNRFLG
jgi:hypothetical protein